jgi:formylmethanofuran dehydrogenase subunit C
MELKLSSPQNCIGDFTYNFIWHHKGAKLNPTAAIPSQSDTDYTYEKVVEALKSGEDVQIEGDVGSRVGSSLGVDLVFFGGSGKELSEVGSIIVDGNAGSHLGLSMLSGVIYVKGEVKEPLGNVVQVTSDLEGYKKFISITWLLHHPEERHGLCEPNVFKNEELLLGMNAAALLNGGEVVILGDAAEFLGVELRKGRVFVKGNCKGFVGAEMTGGRIICRRAELIPPVIERKLEKADLALLARFGISGILALTYAGYTV